MILRRIGRARRSPITDQLTALLSPYTSWNAFNPSVLADGSKLHVVFRAYRRGEPVKPFNAYYASCVIGESPTATAEPDLLDLSAYARGHDVPLVADPKLFDHDGRTFVTFNTGSSAGGPNDIYIMQVAPTVGPPQRCVLEPRHRVEKNWGFYGADGSLHALYSLDPLVRLRLERGVPGSAGDLQFARDPRDADAAVSFHGGRFKRNISIGTQPIRVDGALTLIAHEKLYVHKFFGYSGRFVTLQHIDADRPTVNLSTTRWVHSLRSIRPRRGTHNREALFVTYFCGLSLLDDGSLLISYGINDIAFGFARVANTSRMLPRSRASSTLRGNTAPPSDRSLESPS